MNKIYSVFILATIVAAFASFGCAPTQPNLVLRDATVSCNSTATTIETTQGLALILYKMEQELAVQAAVNAGETKQQAIVRVGVVRKAWIPVWDTFAKARASYAALSALIQSAENNGGALQSAVSNLDARMTDVRNQLSIARSRVQGGVQ